MMDTKENLITYFKRLLETKSLKEFLKVRDSYTENGIWQSSEIKTLRKNLDPDVQELVKRVLEKFKQL